MFLIMKEENFRELMSQFCINTKIKLTKITVNQNFKFNLQFRNVYDEDVECPSKCSNKIINELGDTT